jgi:hypothetical protein
MLLLIGGKKSIREHAHNNKKNKIKFRNTHKFVKTMARATSSRNAPVKVGDFLGGKASVRTQILGGADMPSTTIFDGFMSDTEDALQSASEAIVAVVDGGARKRKASGKKMMKRKSGGTVKASGIKKVSGGKKRKASGKKRSGKKRSGRKVSGGAMEDSPVVAAEVMAIDGGARKRKASGKKMMKRKSGGTVKASGIKKVSGGKKRKASGKKRSGKKVSGGKKRSGKKRSGKKTMKSRGGFNTDFYTRLN